MARIQKRLTTSGATTYVVKWRTPDGGTVPRAGSARARPPMPSGRRPRTPPLQGLVFDPNVGKMLFREAAAIWLESRKADIRNNAGNHRYALAPASTRQGDGKTSALTRCSAATRSTRSPASTSRRGLTG